MSFILNIEITSCKDSVSRDNNISHTDFFRSGCTGLIFGNRTTTRLSLPLAFLLEPPNSYNDTLFLPECQYSFFLSIVDLS